MLNSLFLGQCVAINQQPREVLMSHLGSSLLIQVQCSNQKLLMEWGRGNTKLSFNIIA